MTEKEITQLTVGGIWTAFDYEKFEVAAGDLRKALKDVKGYRTKRVRQDRWSRPDIRLSRGPIVYINGLMYVSGYHLRMIAETFNKNAKLTLAVPDNSDCLKIYSDMSVTTLQGMVDTFTVTNVYFLAFVDEGQASRGE